jgi:hypothetical protein
MRYPVASHIVFWTIRFNEWLKRFRFLDGITGADPDRVVTRRKRPANDV